MLSKTHCPLLCHWLDAPFADTFLVFLASWGVVSQRQNHRIIECQGFGMDLKDHLVPAMQPLLAWAGYLPQRNPDFELLQSLCDIPFPRKPLNFCHTEDRNINYQPCYYF